MKTLIKSLLIASIIFLFSTYALAGNTTVVTGQNQVITITGLDADWDASTETKTKDLLRNGVLKVLRVVFIPSATNDRMIIRDNGIDAAEFYDVGKQADTYDGRTVDFPEPLYVNPVIDISDCTFGTAANAKVMIYISKPKP